MLIIAVIGRVARDGHPHFKYDETNLGRAVAALLFYLLRNSAEGAAANSPDRQLGAVVSLPATAEGAAQMSALRAFFLPQIPRFFTPQSHLKNFSSTLF